jgi:hypothetical protein
VRKIFDTTTGNLFGGLSTAIARKNRHGNFKRLKQIDRLSTPALEQIFKGKQVYCLTFLFNGGSFGNFTGFQMSVEGIGSNIIIYFLKHHL